MVTIAKDLSSTVTLNDGVVMPMFGLGTYMLSTGEGQGAETITSFALQNGYRMVDTATLYGNEKEVGRGVKNSGLSRSEVFVVTKLWDSDHGYENCKAAFMKSLGKLDTGYVDLYLIHSPLGGDNLRTYDAMLELKQQGLIRSVGVSSFGVAHLEGLRKAGRPLPSVNQIELHPLHHKQSVVDYCRVNGIALMAYTPLIHAEKMNDKTMNEVAKRYGKSLAQLLLRYSVQKGFIPIPKTSNKKRIIENTQVFDWSIKDEDMELLESLPGYRCDWDPTTSSWDNLA
jgi:diketogulonate reductase-like aldo/keto reductase